MSTNRAEQMFHLWLTAQAVEPKPGDALMLLADAIAFGLNEGDYNPQQVLERIQQSFDTLHIAKYAPHLARKQ